MLGIRQKLAFGFIGLLLIAALIGIHSVWQFRELGRSIDVILRENYRSVIACQDMKEALERTDSGVLFVLLGESERGNRLIDEHTESFAEALAIVQGNVTVPGERGRVDALSEVYSRYLTTLRAVRDPSSPLPERRAVYFADLLPMFTEVKSEAQAILEMNQKNMNEANVAARRQAAGASRSVFIFLLVSGLVAGAFVFFTGRWILRPLRSLIASADDIRRGNLELVTKSPSRDEIGQLSEAFNAMAASLREMRRSDRMQVVRSRRATEEVFRHLPVAVAVVDLDGAVEIATETAERAFGLKPGANLRDLPFEWLRQLVDESLTHERIVQRDQNGGMVQQFIDNEEFFFQPMALPIRSGVQGEQIGTAIILKDVTKAREQADMKKGVISTVSHQLKTPLTSIRMAVHLLLEEKVGSLTEKQADLLLAARDDSERLVTILDDLLDISRMESGNVSMAVQPVSPVALTRDAAEALEVEARDRGVELLVDVSDGLPHVDADPARISHVFHNLLSNALKYTGAGGTVTVSAVVQPEGVQFSVADTGIGIPSPHLDRVFDRFYRVPGQEEKAGVGLGLAIVREIVRTHGGHTGVESAVGRGSTFWFTLPIADAQRHMV